MPHLSPLPWLIFPLVVFTFILLTMVNFYFTKPLKVSFLSLITSQTPTLKSIYAQTTKPPRYAQKGLFLAPSGAFMTVNGKKYPIKKLCLVL